MIATNAICVLCGASVPFEQAGELVGGHAGSCPSCRASWAAGSETGVETEAEGRANGGQEMTTLARYELLPPRFTLGEACWTLGLKARTLRPILAQLVGLGLLVRAEKKRRGANHKGETVWTKTTRGKT